MSVRRKGGEKDPSVPSLALATYLYGCVGVPAVAVAYSVELSEHNAAVFAREVVLRLPDVAYLELLAGPEVKQRRHQAVRHAWVIDNATMGGGGERGVNVVVRMRRGRCQCQ